MKKAHEKNTGFGILCVALAASLWGTTGLCNRMLSAFDFSQPQIVFLRTSIAALVLAVILLLRDREAFRIRLRDLWCFFGSGVVSLFVFSLSYFSAMQEMSLAAAATLLYLAPVVVVLLSALFFRERITRVKLLALVLVLFGAVCVTGLLGSLLGSGAGVISGRGLLFGLMSAVGYALYSIFSRFAMQRGYRAVTITFYTVLFAAAAAACASDLPQMAHIIASGGASCTAWVLYLGIATCLGPYLLYTRGLENVENGRASIVATLELVVATLVSVLVFAEPFTWSSALGIACVLAGVVVMNVGGKGPVENQGD